MSAWRHLRAIGLLPGVVTIVVPAVILWIGDAVRVGWGLPAGLAVAPVLAGAALLVRFAAVFAVNAVYMPLVEEPGLVRRFGAEYETYRAHVRRWVPSPRPWDPGHG